MIFFLYFLQFLFRLIFLLPPKLAIILMNLAGEATYQIACRTPIRKTVANNFSLVFPNIKITNTDVLAKKTLHNIAYSIFELLCMPFLTPYHVSLISQIIGRENIEAGLKHGKGVLLLMMHTGNYEITPVILTSQGYKINSILKATNDPMFKFLNKTRGHKGAKIINVLESNMYSEALKVLKQNEIVGLLIDTGALEGRHEMLPFLGRKVPVATGWLTLAERSKAAVIPGYSKREGEKLIYYFSEPLQVSRDNREATIEKVRQFYEELIKNNPEQWAIFLNEYEVKRMVAGK
ncbi:MAG: lysophospholipid acyltransferase family protein [bacterium]